MPRNAARPAAYSAPVRPSRRRELYHRRRGARMIVGLDEVGRGSLAGPLVTAAVALPLDRRLTWMPKLRDSKVLTARQRERLAPAIQRDALQCGIGWVHAAELDSLGMTAALRLAARRAIAQLSTPPDIVLADGNGDLRLSEPVEEVEMVVRGDAKVASIAAASVVAKTVRDAWMSALEPKRPGYGFARHKGYGTPQHLRALRELGPCAEHRRTFAPVSALLQPRLALGSAADAAP